MRGSSNGVRSLCAFPSRARLLLVFSVVGALLLAGSQLFPCEALAVSGGAGTGTGAESPYETTVADLVAANPVLDGTEVRFVGEAIGEPIDADVGHVWVNVAGQEKLIGVYLTNDQAEQITDYGGYLVEGTQLQITGTFDTSCSMHDGELDVHADNVSTVSSGGTVSGDEGTWKLYAGGSLIVAGAVMWLVYRYRRRKSL